MNPQGLKDLNLSLEESRDIMELSARKRRVNNYQYMANDELLPALKESKKNNQPKKPLKLTKQEISKNNQPKKPLKLTKQEISKNNQPKKPLKLTKQEISKNNQPEKPLKLTKQEIKCKNKERINVIREELKELSYKLSKSELKEISL